MSNKATGPSGVHLGAAGDKGGQPVVTHHYNRQVNPAASDRPGWPRERRSP